MCKSRNFRVVSRRTTRNTISEGTQPLTRAKSFSSKEFSRIKANLSRVSFAASPEDSPPAVGISAAVKNKRSNSVREAESSVQ